MKKILLLLVLAAAGIWGIGRAKLGESGAMRFLANMETLMRDGKAEEVCAMFHEDLEMQISDDSGETRHNVSGGKAELCDLTRATVASLNLLPNEMTVEYTGVNAKQDLRHPWTSEVSYHENRSFTVKGTDLTLRTVSNDEITLVHTFSGVKLRKLKSDVYKAGAT